MLSILLQLWLLMLPLRILGEPAGQPAEIYIRVNQVGYLPGERKSAILFSHAPVKERYRVIRSLTGEVIFTARPVQCEEKGWGTFKYYYLFDFSGINEKGTYILEGVRSGQRSCLFKISDHAYDNLQEELLGFMRQQRCGYNPTLDMVCHQRDGRSFYGPMPDSTYLDVSGGWHDAGDQLKYLITGSYATAHLLMAYELYPEKFGDRTNALGQPGANGIPDLLDEARWGLEWICTGSAGAPGGR